MPAFYIVSGICSNYEKSFSSFLISKIISLKIPIFFFIGIPGCLGIWTLYGFSPFDIKLWIIRMFESGPWFLHAIFLSQILIYVIKRLVANQTLQFIVCIILYTIGGISIINHLYPCFWIFHSLMLTIFLLIGKVINEYVISKGYIALFVFFIVVTTLNIIGYKLPHIVQNPVINYYMDLPIILILSTSGSLGFLWICRKINQSPILEYIGKYSLMVYLLHYIFITFFMKYIYITNNDSIINVLSLFIITLISIISLCLAIAYLLDKPYIRIAIGKKP